MPNVPALEVTMPVNHASPPVSPQQLGRLLRLRNLWKKNELIQLKKPTLLKKCAELFRNTAGFEKDTKAVLVERILEKIQDLTEPPPIQPVQVQEIPIVSLPSMSPQIPLSTGAIDLADEQARAALQQHPNPIIGRNLGSNTSTVGHTPNVNPGRVIIGSSFVTPVTSQFTPQVITSQHGNSIKN